MTRISPLLANFEKPIEVSNFQIVCPAGRWAASSPDRVRNAFTLPDDLVDCRDCGREI